MLATPALTRFLADRPAMKPRYRRVGRLLAQLNAFRPVGAIPADFSYGVEEGVFVARGRAKDWQRLSDLPGAASLFAQRRPARPKAEEGE